MKLAWLTDVHLNFVAPNVRAELLGSIRSSSADAVLLGGDIGEAGSFREYLEGFARELGIPVYFVLGNHDYYGGSIAAIREELPRWTARAGVTWLTTAEPIELTAGTGLIGHDGWADARAGDFLASHILLNDYVQIAELEWCRLDRVCLAAKLNELGDEAAAAVEHRLADACSRFQRVVLLTHVPPFREACWHEGRISDGEWLPHFACKVMGEAILRVMASHPQVELTVLCGHTHSSGVAQLAPNVVVKTGGADYGRPRINEVIEV